MSEAKIATSENGCHLAHFRTLLATKARPSSTWTPPYVPATKWPRTWPTGRRTAACRSPPDGCQELQLPLAAAVANGEFLEYYPAAVDPLCTEMFQPILKPDADGYELNMDLLNRYRVG